MPIKFTKNIINLTSKNWQLKLMRKGKIVNKLTILKNKTNKNHQFMET